MRVCIVGTGYVGLSLATLLSKRNEVVAVDLVKEKVDSINNRVSPIVDEGISSALVSRELNLRATTDIGACVDADFVIIATPTNYDPETDRFDTGSVDSVIANVSALNPHCTIVIKSTVPIGYTARKVEEGFRNVLFSPEFLREGKALYDNLHPSRIVVGIPHDCINMRPKAEEFASLLSDAAEGDVPTLIVGSTEAESIKLFSNTYLAMRVAFFNELDSFAEMHSLDSGQIIKGVSLDPRIGDWYNNPSFGYGGYCLPKDTKQLLSDYRGTPNDLIYSIVRSNATRKEFIADRISEMLGGKGTIGVYRLTMKSGSDNFREASIIDVAHLLESRGFRVLVYEPSISDRTFDGFEVIGDLESFRDHCNLIITNRYDSENLSGCRIYTRDLFYRD